MRTLVPTAFFFSIVRLAFLAVALQHFVRLTSKAFSLGDARPQARLTLLGLPLLLLAAFGLFLAQQRWWFAMPRRDGSTRSTSTTLGTPRSSGSIRT